MFYFAKNNKYYLVNFQNEENKKGVLYTPLAWVYFLKNIN
jgi:hypothetical protein